MAGGGIVNAGTATISRTTFDGNRAGHPWWWWPLQCHLEGAIVTITDSTFVRNRADRRVAASSTLRDRDPHETPPLPRIAAMVVGGGLRNHGLARLRNTTFAENTVGLAGGGNSVAGAFTWRRSRNGEHYPGS